MKERGKKMMKVRDEIQEYPNKPLEDAFMDKIKKMMMMMAIELLKPDFNK
jgi:hypothetical protein